MNKKVDIDEVTLTDISDLLIEIRDWLYEIHRALTVEENEH